MMWSELRIAKRRRGASPLCKSWRSRQRPPRKSDRNLRRLVAARFVSKVGGEAAFFVGIWGRAAFELDATPLSLAVLMATLGVTTMAGSTLAGLLVDRFGPRRVLLVGEAAFAPIALSLVVPDTMGGLTVAVAGLGLVGAVVYTAITAFPAYLTHEPARLVKVNGAVEAAGTAAFIAGPAVGALLARYAGLDWIFVLDAATSVVAVAVAARVTVRPTPAAVVPQPTRALAGLRDGLAFLYGHPALRFYLVLGLLTWLSFGAFGALEPIFYREVLRANPETLGWVNSIFGIGLVAGAGLLQRLPAGFTCARTAALLTVAGGLGAVAYTGTDRLGVVIAAAVGWGFVLGLLLPVLRSLVQLATPEGMIGRAMGSWNAHHSVGELAPLVAVPWLAAAFGVQRVLVGSGVALAVVGVALIGRAARLDRAAQPTVSATPASGGPPRPAPQPVPP